MTTDPIHRLNLQLRTAQQLTADDVNRVIRPDAAVRIAETMWQDGSGRLQLAFYMTCHDAAIIKTAGCPETTLTESLPLALESDIYAGRLLLLQRMTDHLNPLAEIIDGRWRLIDVDNEPMFFREVVENALKGPIAAVDIKNPQATPSPAAMNAATITYPVELPEHLSGPNGFNSNQTLSAVHNRNNALQDLIKKGATYHLSTTATQGISEIDYKYFCDVRTKYIAGRKTLYDPEIYSDQDMFEMSLNAGKLAYELYIGGNTQKSYDITENGINFRAYINIEADTLAPYLSNVHPIGDEGR